ncbi:MAG: glycosyltransferase, partial [Thermoanaerobaculia bacterium]|nr:glycosyltransferase [Thermoanaerobaculia bacterium]
MLPRVPSLDLVCRGASQPVQASAPGQDNDALDQPPLISVVMPCLNEADGVAECIGKALRGIAKTGLAGEVVVVDNGSSDGSAEIAARAGARVV